MRLRGVHHVEFNVLDYEKSLEFYDRMFGWLGYSSFSTLNIEYQGTYYVAYPHSYIGIQPARQEQPLDFDAWQPGIHHIALQGKNRKEIDRFHTEFLLRHEVQVVDPPAEYPHYAPGYYAVFFKDPSGIKWELAHFPIVPSPRAFYRWYKLLSEEKKKHPEWQRHPMHEGVRKLPKP